MPNENPPTATDPRAIADKLERLLNNIEIANRPNIGNTIGNLIDAEAFFTTVALGHAAAISSALRSIPDLRALVEQHQSALTAVREDRAQTGRVLNDALRLIDKYVGRIAALEDALEPLGNIAKAWESNELDDEARRFWGTITQRENKAPPEQIELYQGRGGKRLLTLADCFKAREALDKTEPPADLEKPPENKDESAPSQDFSITGLVALSKRLRALESFGYPAQKTINDAADAIMMPVLEWRKKAFDTVKGADISTKPNPLPQIHINVDAAAERLRGRKLRDALKVILERYWGDPAAHVSINEIAPAGVALAEWDAGVDRGLLLEQGDRLVYRTSNPPELGTEFKVECVSSQNNSSPSTVYLRQLILARIDPIKRWPFRESPGDFTKRLYDAIAVVYPGAFPGVAPLLAAVRAVLIEEPPALADWLNPGAAAIDAAKYNLLVIALRHAFPQFQNEEPIEPQGVLDLGKEYNKMFLGWEPSKSEIKFLDDVGNEWTIRREEGDAPGDLYWTLEDGAVVLTEEEHEALKKTAKPPASKNKIITAFVNPPIPIRAFDWSATRKGFEPGEPFGWGRTEIDAVNALLEAEEERS